MSNKLAIVVGHQGQDGRLLIDLLLQNNYSILGIGRQSNQVWGKIPRIRDCVLSQPESIFESVKQLLPTEIYYLAAHHASSQTRNGGETYGDYLAGNEVNTLGLLNFLEAVKQHSKESRVFYAASSLIFGNHPPETPQVETTRLSPEEPYGIQKAASVEMCRTYRVKFGLFVSTGILFNHESHLRGRQFLSMKLILAAIAAHRGIATAVKVGNLDATVDWGFAPDYVRAFWQILGADEPGDFVVATGKLHTVRDFADAAFRYFGLDWKDFVNEDRDLLFRYRSGRVGDPSKLRSKTGWQPTVSFEGMVSRLIEDCLQLDQRPTVES